ncbi:MAG: phosphatase [Sulfurimonas sp.]|jgi:exopolyphosphatase/guanosine-5'-triphosphate,3'-diphosphate pyrophosphatase
MIAIDLGSNTIRFIEYDGKNWGKSFEKIVRTAEGLSKNSEINALALERIISAIDEAKSILDFRSHEVVAITTAAMRMAHNSKDILQKIQNRTGITFQVIDGEKEAKLTLEAVVNRLDSLNIPSDDFILVDIGGGSTEIIVVSGSQTQVKSFPLGIVTLSEKSYITDILESELKFYHEMIAHYIEELALLTPPKTLVMTAGTPTTMVAYQMGMNYVSYDASKINGTFLKRSDCSIIHNELMEMDEKTRAKYVGAGRESLISTGIHIVEMIFEVLNNENALVIDDGLREGVALNYYSEGYI